MRMAALVGVIVLAIGLTVGGLLRGGDEQPEPEVSVDFGDTDGLPDELVENTEYRATFTIDWEGPTAINDGQANVFASRMGDTTEDAPADGWPLVCEAEYDNVVFRARLTCPLESPGPGEFALLLQVVGPNGDTLGESLYTHLVVLADGAASTSVP